MSLRLFHVLFVLLCLALGGCRSGEPRTTEPLAPSSDDAVDAAVALLEETDEEALRTAFERLPDYGFTRRLRTVQFDPAEEDRIAAIERVVRHTFRDGERIYRVQTADTVGTFAFGLLRHFADPAPLRDPQAAISSILPEEPPYLSPRHRDAYRYRVLADTVLWGRPVQVIAVGARPEEGEGQNIRRARLYIDRATHALLALSVRYRRDALLFQEQSAFFVSLRPAPDSGWVPYRTSVRTRIDVPLLPPRLFQTQAMYYGYEADRGE